MDPVDAHVEMCARLRSVPAAALVAFLEERGAAFAVVDGELYVDGLSPQHAEVVGERRHEVVAHVVRDRPGVGAVIEQAVRAITVGDWAGADAWTSIAWEREQQRA